MREPRELVEKIEIAAALPGGRFERFSGYAVLGVPFASGHVLALRRFAASSIGPGYTSVWHRDPRGNWTFYQDTIPQQGCSRYFGRLIKENILEDIAIDWPGPREMEVRVGGKRPVSWQLSLDSSWATALMNAGGRLVPESWWQSPRVLRLIGGAARLALRAGRLNLSGEVPNGQTFVANPRMIWVVPASHAVIAAEDAGPMGPLAEQARLGDFCIPQRGLFAIAQAFLERFDDRRHSQAVSAEVNR